MQDSAPPQDPEEATTGTGETSRSDTAEFAVVPPPEKSHDAEKAGKAEETEEVEEVRQAEEAGESEAAEEDAGGAAEDEAEAPEDAAEDAPEDSGVPEEPGQPEQPEEPERPARAEPPKLDPSGQWTINLPSPAPSPSSSATVPEIDPKPALKAYAETVPEIDTTAYKPETEQEPEPEPVPEPAEEEPEAATTAEEPREEVTPEPEPAPEPEPELEPEPEPAEESPTPPAAFTSLDLPAVQEPPQQPQRRYAAPQAFAPPQPQPPQSQPQPRHGSPQGYAPPPQQQFPREAQYPRESQYAQETHYAQEAQYARETQYPRESTYTREPQLQPQPQQQQYEQEQERDYGAVYDAAAAEAKGGKKKRRGLIFAVVVLLVVAGAVAGQLLRPLPDPTVRLTIPTSSHTFPGAAPTLPWPVQGQSALYVEGLGMMGSSGGTVPTPTASVAKVMTAYVFLKEHPLATGQPGPTYTVAPEAAAQIPSRKQRGESLLGVTAGMRLTERKALEALMVISANDVAHELARWDSGDPKLFVQKMNDTAKALGMTSTTYTDPSGYLSTTVSTAADQLKLLRAAMRVPAFVEIVSKRAYVPDGPGQTRPGGNILLGQYGVLGGKTGYTDAAGGNYVFAARKDVGGVSTLFLGAVMGQQSPSAMGALQVGRDLVAAAQSAVTAVTLAPQGARVAQVDDGLGGRTPLNAAAPVTVVGWPGLTVQLSVDGDPPHTAGQGERVASVKTGAASVPLQLGQNLDEPSIPERLIRLQ
ncbi:hypothetical protein [Spirillospora sp. NPDC029432]|uniref:D-alanyl-D-alanine carboxypeptidase family protein n=1 Tax=Spirillospora sp. NPDC029432 TaxID=3154599 RepID=UPI003452227D